jgi:hypothetical protein
MISTLGLCAESIKINYSARIIGLTQLNPGPLAALNDFLANFGLSTINGATGVEIPISGSYTYEYPQPDQAGNGAYWGTYLLTDFQLNGVPLALSPAVYPRIDMALPPGGIDVYAVGFSDSPTPFTDGATRSMLLQLGLALPSGTFQSDALLPNIDFFPLATNYETTSGATFRYYVQPPAGDAVSISGHTIWLSAEVQTVPEPASWTLAAAGACGLGLLRRARRRNALLASVHRAYGSAAGGTR